MSRIRTIKPEVLSDEKAAHLTHEAWRLWVSMWVIADDAGRLPASPGFLAGQVFWGCPADAEAALAELVSAGLVMTYSVKNETYAVIAGWSKHQRINRPSGPKYPEPQGPDPVVTDTSVRAPVVLDADRDRDHDRDHEHEGDRERDRCASREPPAAPSRARRPSGKGGAGNLLPADWEPRGEHEALARDRGADVAREAEHFRAWCKSRGVKSADWNAAFSSWLHKAAQFSARAGPGRSAGNGGSRAQELYRQAQALKAREGAP
jgi:hypothetical protein